MDNFDPLQESSARFEQVLQDSTPPDRDGGREEEIQDLSGLIRGEFRVVRYEEPVRQTPSLIVEGGDTRHPLIDDQQTLGEG